MDTLTHMAIGACIGEAMCGKKLGKRALLLGAAAQCLPDIDFLASFWMSPAENLLAHRGFTHSLLFVALATPLLALATWQLHRPHNIAVRKWMLFFALQGLVHIFLDGFNAYGTGWLEPFSHRRFSFNVLYVADPLFSLGPTLALLALLVLRRRNHRWRVLWWLTGLLAAGAYLLYAVSNKLYIDRTVKETLAQQHIGHADFITTPTPFNNWLWYVVAKSPAGFYIGFRSVFDARKDMVFHFVPQNDSLLRSVSDHESLQHLIRFSRGYYTVAQWKDTLVFNDLRFGQIAGWQNPAGRFVFHYYLSHHTDNTLVVQRGRFEGWNMHTVRSLLSRIEGN